MEIILAIATILGGLTALWFFYDKYIHHKNSIIKEERQESSKDITKKSSLPIEITTEQDLKRQIKNKDGHTFIIFTDTFPDIQFFITGDIHTHYPPYEIQILFENKDIGFPASHMQQLKNIFQPLIILGQELEIINIHREDELGVRLKTAYLSAPDREKVFSNTASVVYNLFYNVISIPKTEQLKFEDYNELKHYKKDSW